MWTIIKFDKKNLSLLQNDLKQKKENRDALKIAFFTAKMNLNTEESRLFWPVVNEMEN